MNRKILNRTFLTILGVAFFISEKSMAIIDVDGQSAMYTNTKPIDSIIIKYKNKNNIKSFNLQQVTGLNLSIQDEIGNGAIVYKITNTNFNSMSNYDAINHNERLNEELEKLRNNPEIAYADPNVFLYAMKAPDDTKYNEQWHYFEDKGGINLPKAWDVTTGNDVVVGVIDSGIVKHVDYDSKVLQGRSFVGGDVNDFYDKGYSPRAGLVIYHGSHVAGTIGAMSNNSTGVSGVSWGAKILPVKVMDGNSGTMDGILKGMRWAAGLDAINRNSNPARVLNLSLGGQGSCYASFQDVINELVAKNVIVVVAAGNGDQFGNPQPAKGFVPANCNNVVTVAATNRNGGQARYSNYGEDVIDIAAPGGETAYQDDPNGILSTHAPNNYGFLQGTSMAAPHVAGVVALMLSINPNLKHADVEKYLRQGARGNIFGTGIMDAYKTLQLVKDGGASDPTDPTDPEEPTDPTDPTDPTTPNAVKIESGIPYWDQTGKVGDKKLFYIDVSINNATYLTIWNYGGSGIPFMMVGYNKIPTTSNNECAADKYSTRNCLFFSPKAGRYYISLDAYDYYSGVTLWTMFN